MTILSLSENCRLPAVPTTLFCPLTITYLSTPIIIIAGSRELLQTMLLLWDMMRRCQVLKHRGLRITEFCPKGDYRYIECRG